MDATLGSSINPSQAHNPSLNLLACLSSHVSLSCLSFYDMPSNNLTTDIDILTPVLSSRLHENPAVFQSVVTLLFKNLPLPTFPMRQVPEVMGWERGSGRLVLESSRASHPHSQSPGRVAGTVSPVLVPCVQWQKMVSNSVGLLLVPHTSSSSSLVTLDMMGLGKRVFAFQLWPQNVGRRAYHRPAQDLGGQL